MNNKLLSLVLLLGIASTGFVAYTNADDSALWKLMGNKSEIRQLMQKLEAGETLTDEEQALVDEAESHKAEMQEIYNLLQKQENGETLTADEQAQLDAWKANKPEWKGPRGMGGFGKRSGFGNLTEEEKTALESMSDEEKQAFFEEKKAQMQAERQAEKAVIDKLIGGESLTADEEALRLELLAKFESEDTDGKDRRGGGDIIAKLLAGDELTDEEQTQLEQMQAKKAEREAAREALAPILEKVQNGETLTDDEQALLDENKAMGRGGEFGEKGGNHGMRGDFDGEMGDDANLPTTQTN